jgi:HK97 family phage prohead protease
VKHEELLNKRTLREAAGAEIRAVEENDAHVIIGTIPYNRDSSPFLGFIEVITPQAFERSLKEGAEIKALVNHDSRALLGSSGNGTLTLTSGDAGLSCRCELPKTSYAADLYEVVKRGDVKTLSFGFMPKKYREENNKLYLEEGELFEVSFGVSFPAYKDTNTVIERSVGMKSLVKREIDADKLKEILDKEELSEEEIEEVKALISLLEKKVGSAGEDAAPEPERKDSWRSLAEKHGFYKEVEK